MYIGGRLAKYAYTVPHHIRIPRTIRCRHHPQTTRCVFHYTLAAGRLHLTKLITSLPHMRMTTTITTMHSMRCPLLLASIRFPRRQSMDVGMPLVRAATRTAFVPLRITKRVQKRQSYPNAIRRATYIPHLTAHSHHICMLQRSDGNRVCNFTPEAPSPIYRCSAAASVPTSRNVVDAATTTTKSKIVPKRVFRRHIQRTGRTAFCALS